MAYDTDESESLANSHDDEIGHDYRELEAIQRQPGDLLLSNPSPPLRLGRLSVMCVICNRMIGTGIFSTPSSVILYTQSVGVTLLFWLAGAFCAIAGILVFIEYGLTTPRYYFERRGKISVPRNGGELHYLKDVLRKPAFFTTCVFGITFILLGNVAPNSIQFGIRVMSAAGRTVNDPQGNWIVRIIAIAVVTFSCLLHGTWRQGGIYLNNLFAVVKIALLLFTIAIGLAATGNAFPSTKPSTSNLDTNTSFASVTKDSYALAESFLSIIFAYDGFSQANYVLSEVDNPRRNYKWPAFSAVVMVSVLYMAVNIVYMLVVPFSDQIKPSADVAREFFNLTVGTLSGGSNTIGPRVLDAFMAISSLGNVIVMTYTAARVKQEIAIEGILPLRKFIARSVQMPSIPFGRFFTRRSAALTEPTPIGALILHWTLSVILILATVSQGDPATTYSLLVKLYTYTIVSFFCSLLGLGLLVLRFLPSRKWSSKSAIPGIPSTIAAFVFFIANAFPLAGSWVPPSTAYLAITTANYPWFLVPTIGWACITSGVIYWVVYYFLVPRWGSHRGLKLRVEKELYLHEEHGYPVQWHEKLIHQWVVPRDEDEEDSDSGMFLERDIVHLSRD